MEVFSHGAVDAWATGSARCVVNKKKKKNNNKKKKNHNTDNNNDNSNKISYSNR